VNTFKPKRTKNDLISNIEVSINELFYKSCISTEKILGMGIAVAGIVDYQTGVIKITDLLPKIDFDISSIFEEKYSFPTFVENNANAASIGAKWVGPASGVNNFITVLIEVGPEVGGLGLGIVINGEIYHGFSFCSGELDVRLPTITGILGHLRHKMVKGTYFHKFQNQVRKITLQHLVDAAKLEETVAIQYFQKLGHVIGKAIASPIALLNPELVVITGKIAQIGDLLIQPIQKEVQLHTLDITNQVVRFGEHPYSSFSVSIGAASLILDDFFKVPTVQKESSF
jgi:predicted NBD/HSP70 family sugar kinase